MSVDERLDRMLVGLLADDAPSRPPDRLVPETLRALRRVRRWPRWFALMKEPPMRYSSRVAVGSPTARLLSIAALSLLLLLATLGAVMAGARVLSADAVPPPFGPARNGAIAFSRDGDIYLADPDGVSERAIIKGPEVDGDPRFSHDGTMIAFGREVGDATALMVAEANGTNARELLANVGNAEFAASDDQLIAIRPLDEGPVLSVVDAITGAIRDLDLGGIQPYDWVLPRPPDGQEIVFVGHPAAGDPAAGIYAIHLDGTGLRTIGTISTTESDVQISFQGPSLSPDGSVIAYWNWERNAEHLALGPYLHVRDMTTGTDLPVSFQGDDVLHAWAPAFLPNGRDIIFERYPGPDASPERLYVASIDGSVPAVPFGPEFSLDTREGFEVSPDGAKVLLVDGASVIIDVGTGTVASTDIVSSPAWQRLAP